MSTPPEKPQPHGPLHNFSLPHNWSKNHSNNLNRGRRLGESSSQQQAASVNAAVLRFQESLSLQQPVLPSASNLRSQLPDSVQRLSFSPGASSPRQKPRARESVSKAILHPRSDSKGEKSKMDSPASVRRDEGERSQLSPGFQLRMRKKAEEVVPQDKDKSMTNEEEEEKKSWNFRPRKPVRKPRSGNPGISKVDRSTNLQDDKLALSSIPESSGGGKSAPRKPQKPMFSLSLTQEEIEEDIFAMTGARPSRKPKRRPKAVQKQLDAIFPGMWLGSVTPDAYKVPDPSKKK